MLALVGPAPFATALWTTWIPLGTGALVACMVFGFTVVYSRWRRRDEWRADLYGADVAPAAASREEDLPWQDLLALLEKHNSERAKVGLPPEKPTEEVLAQLVASLPTQNASPLERPEDREFQALGIDERRGGQRRWGNPISVQLVSPQWEIPLHGIVVNRSTGGLGIFADQEIPPGTLVQLRPADAPWYVQTVEVEVRHCSKVGKGFLFGCEFSEDVPWKVRVWFG